MARYHVNKQGEPGVCSAMVQCPFGDLDQDHYDSKEQARKAYEDYSAGKTLPPIARKYEEQLAPLREKLTALKAEEGTLQSKNNQMQRRQAKLTAGRDGIDAVLSSMSLTEEHQTALSAVRADAVAQIAHLQEKLDKGAQRRPEVSRAINELNKEIKDIEIEKFRDQRAAGELKPHAVPDPRPSSRPSPWSSTPDRDPADWAPF